MSAMQQVPVLGAQQQPLDTQLGDQHQFGTLALPYEAQATIAAPAMLGPQPVCFQGCAVAGGTLAFVPLAAVPVLWFPMQPQPSQKIQVSEASQVQFAETCAGSSASGGMLTDVEEGDDDGDVASLGCEDIEKQRHLQPAQGATHAHDAVRGNVWPLSRRADGCRRVQAAMSAAETDEERGMLVGELRGYVWQAVQCRYANFVVQHAVRLVGEDMGGFIVEEIVARGAGGACRMARHAFGCRVLQRVLERWSSQVVDCLMEHLLTESILLCRHTFGNYVIGHVLLHGLEKQRAALVADMARYATALGSDTRAARPLAVAIEHGAAEDVARIARALLGQEGLVASMACARRGHTAVQGLISRSEPAEFGEAARQLSAGADKPSSSRYGRTVMRCLQERMRCGALASA
eukprot:CAMPEP_0170252384 /NCGR_PEP_ID=MMETSP0116_2-20130129/26026_1 /TAXON_ID=400756 /ORGANISM="Durinskia baltica, Strain CSIRO CS-38" /LENGTH=405 /DNA_ID=CAMNT_0010503355 /DNA_START=66 /DNA_END=1283 /DNA_ORIENTATION=-